MILKYIFHVEKVGMSRLEGSRLLHIYEKIHIILTENENIHMDINILDILKCLLIENTG